MFWRGNLDDVSRLIQTSVKEAVASEMAPMRVTVSQLTDSTNRQAAKMEALMVDHVTRNDLDRLRAEMQQGFMAMGSTYMPKELSDQRYKDVTDRLKDLETQRNGMSNNLVVWAFLAFNSLLALAGLLVAILHK